MISVPPLKSIVQFMYSPRTDLLTNNEPIRVWPMSRIEMTSQILNFATNAKLLPGGRRYRTYIAHWSARLRSRSSPAWPFFLAIYQSKKMRVTQNVGGQRGEHTDEQHDGEPSDRARSRIGRSTQPAAAVVQLAVRGWRRTRGENPRSTAPRTDFPSKSSSRIRS